MADLNITRSIDESKITNTARVSVTWDSYGIAVDLNYSYDENLGYGEGALCFCEIYADGAPDQSAWNEALCCGRFLKEKYNLPLDINRDEAFFRSLAGKSEIAPGVRPEEADHASQLQIVDKYDIEGGEVYTVSLKPGFLVDVKACAGSELVYVMQNDDGSAVYSADGTDSTYLNFAYDETAVIQFVKEARTKETEQTKSEVDSLIKTAVTRATKLHEPLNDNRKGPEPEI